MSRLTTSAERKSDPTLPSPPSLETAAANSADVAPAPIPASIIGTSMPRRSQSRVLSMVLILDQFDALSGTLNYQHNARTRSFKGKHNLNCQSSLRRHNDRYGAFPTGPPDERRLQSSAKCRPAKIVG